MKMTIDAGMMKEMFENWHRDYYTYEACEALENWYDEIDPDFDFDVISICCDWNEYGDTPCLTWENFISDYGYLLDVETWKDENKLDEYDQDLYIDALIDILEGRTIIIRLSESVLVMSF